MATLANAYPDVDAVLVGYVIVITAAAQGVTALILGPLAGHALSALKHF
jgi:hypothetical protein